MGNKILSNNLQTAFTLYKFNYLARPTIVLHDNQVPLLELSQGQGLKTSIILI